MFLGNIFDYGIIHFIIIVAVMGEKICQKIRIIVRNYVAMYIITMFNISCIHRVALFLRSNLSLTSVGILALFDPLY